jgi:transcriptional regulator with XRE-family HTH domain
MKKKSIYTREQALVVKLLREAREKADITQVELAARLKQTQSAISKVERGESRLDLIQLRAWCHIFRVTLPEFVARLEQELQRRK